MLRDGPTVVSEYLNDLSDAISNVDRQVAGKLLARAIRAGRGGNTIYVAGNGGSASTAAHLCTDWNRSFSIRGWSGRMIDLASNISFLTATSNDLSFDVVFANQVAHLGGSEDILLLLSVSGASENLVRAAQIAHKKGMSVMAMLGQPGRLAAMSDTALVVGAGDYGLSEDLHLVMSHIMVRMLRDGAPHKVQSGSV